MERRTEISTMSIPTFHFYFQLPDMKYKVMKVLRWGRKSEMEILCFLHVLEGADSKKVVFEHWSVCHSVILSV